MDILLLPTICLWPYLLGGYGLSLTEIETVDPVMTQIVQSVYIHVTFCLEPPITDGCGYFVVQP